MDKVLGTGQTRDGRRITIRRVVGPDADWARHILPFLAHKGGVWRWQLEQLLQAKLDGLTFRSYLADAAEAGHPTQIVANICTFEAQDVGLFGHVFTLPAWRGQSIARMLTEACIEDFRGRGGQALWLVTGFDSTAYRVYQQFGFESLQPGDGYMAWFGNSGRTELERRFAAGQPVHVRPVNWDDYATFNALSCHPDGSPQRSTILRVVGQSIVEETFLSELMRRMAIKQPVQAFVLATESGWPVGWTLVQRDFDCRWSPNEATLLDIYTHPNYRSHYGELLSAVNLPADSRVISVIDSWDEPRQAALAGAGFAPQGRLTQVYRWADRPVDLIVMTK